MIVDAILWILRTGAPWRDLPEKFGPWATAWDLFNKWNADGTTVRSARCAAGGGKKGIRKNQLITH